jgi:hypothetical protein
MVVNEIHCPGCDTRDLKVHTVYTVQHGETRRLYYCTACQSLDFSQSGGIRDGIQELLRVGLWN